MNEGDFLANYLWPSGDKLDRTYIHEPPDIKGLKRCVDYIIQGEYEDTFSTNIMVKYQSDTMGVKLVDVYKNSQNKVTGVFVRLVGTMSLVKPGYPYLVLDAVVSNVKLSTGEGRDIKTTVAIHLPQADTEQREIVYQCLIDEGEEVGISCQIMQSEAMPNFWGPVLVSQSNGADFNTIHKIREHAWSSYKHLIEEIEDTTPFDYTPFREHMIFNTSEREHLLFKKMGLSVPVEAQAAFFSVMVSEV
jgi:hypothetical protein